MNFVNIKDAKQSILANKCLNAESLNLFSQYYASYYQEKFTDLTFVVTDNNSVLGHVLCYYIDNELTLPGGGVIIKLYEKATQQKQIYTQILDHLCLLAQTHRCKNIVIQDVLEEGQLSILGNQLFNLKFHTHLTFDMEISYHNFNQNTFFSNIRKSYKSLINWGRRELEIIYLNRNNANFEKFFEFQEFHIKIAGRKTRSDESWRQQYKMIEEGHGELILGLYKNQLASGSFFADYGDKSVYFNGVYERDLFDFGISHFLLYEGICRSYQRSNTSKFSLGCFDTNIKDPKLYNIQYFKKGFCNELSPSILWSKEISE